MSKRTKSSRQEPPTSITARESYFIKLGRGSEWEGECLRDGTIRFGYHETPHDLCLKGDWKAIQRFWEKRRGDGGAATRDMNQIRTFYETGIETVFITFSRGLLYWCRPIGSVKVLPDGGRLRGTVEGWNSKSVGGTPLTRDRLSGHLLKVQMFRGTICQVKAFDYLLQKLNDELSPEVIAAEEAEHAMIDSVIGLIRRLTWQDFELLVDLIFSTSGWRRVSRVGGPQKTVDFELVLPTTDERAFVQVKSQANNTSFREYAERFAEADTYKYMFFVWHTGEVAVDDDAYDIKLIGPARLARMTLDAGLTSWLREKVS